MITAPTGWEVAGKGFRSNGVRIVTLVNDDFEIEICIPPLSWVERWRGTTIEAKMQKFIDRAVSLSDRMEAELLD